MIEFIYIYFCSYKTVPFNTIYVYKLFLYYSKDCMKWNTFLIQLTAQSLGKKKYVSLPVLKTTTGFIWRMHNSNIKWIPKKHSICSRLYIFFKKRNIGYLFLWDIYILVSFNNSVLGYHVIGLCQKIISQVLQVLDPSVKPRRNYYP